MNWLGATFDLENPKKSTYTMFPISEDCLILFVSYYSTAKIIIMKLNAFESCFLGNLSITFSSLLETVTDTNEGINERNLKCLGQLWQTNMVGPSRN